MNIKKCDMRSLVDPNADHISCAFINLIVHVAFARFLRKKHQSRLIVLWATQYFNAPRHLFLLTNDSESWRYLLWPTYHRHPLPPWRNLVLEVNLTFSYCFMNEGDWRINLNCNSTGSNRNSRNLSNESYWIVASMEGRTGLLQVFLGLSGFFFLSARVCLARNECTEENAP